jgi:NADH-quinone oxidoreductase subunit M
MDLPVLSIVVFTPIVFGILILLLPKDRLQWIRIVALVGATIALVFSVWAYLSYDQAMGGYQFIERYSWIPTLGISYYVGVDGMNLPLVLLTGIVMFRLAV